MTISTPTILVALILTVLIFVLPTRHILITFAFAAAFIPVDQRILIASLDFTVLRILILAGITRIIISGELTAIRWNKLDKILFAWMLCGALVYILKRGEAGAVIYKSGALFETLGFYWICRQSIRSWDDIKAVINGFALCAVILVPFVFAEWTTGSNPFIIFGRVWTSFREGAYRCQAAFSHAIMFGVFWATLTPMFIAMAVTSRKKLLPALAAAASIFMVWASASSTPLGTLMVALLLLALFKYRCYGRYVAWGLLGIATTLHLTMQAPIWHLLCRIKLVGGSTGYHRYKLIDETVKSFRNWAWLGSGEAVLGDPIHRLFDVTNQYCLEAIRGGLLTLVLFVAFLILAVKTTGKYSLYKTSRTNQLLSWSICVAILGHCISFIGTSYFGQMRVILFLMFALAGTIYGMQSESPAISRPRQTKK